MFGPTLYDLDDPIPKLKQKNYTKWSMQNLAAACLRRWNPIMIILVFLQLVVLLTIMNQVPKQYQLCFLDDMGKPLLFLWCSIFNCPTTSTYHSMTFSEAGKTFTLLQFYAFFSHYSIRLGQEFCAMAWVAGVPAQWQSPPGFIFFFILGAM